MGQHFETTAWSVVVAARGTDSDAANVALQMLCQRYWLPLYTYLRCKGHARESAEDLTQEFFSRLLARDFLRGVEPQRGRFRTFLLACMDHFLSDEWDRQRAAKRGGGALPLTLDVELAEKRCAADGISTLDPCTAFDRQWAETVLDTVARRLEDEHRSAGNLDTFLVLRGFLGQGTGQQGYPAAAERLGISEGAVRVAVHRLRKRFAALTRDEIAQTVEGEAAIQEELSYLVRVLSG